MLKLPARKMLNYKNIIKHFWSFGIVIGVLSAFVLTLIITVWEWIENPSGIFHDQTGTNWSFVYDTAISWFIPTFIQVSIISAVVHIIFSIFNRFWKRD